MVKWEFKSEVSFLQSQAREAGEQSLLLNMPVRTCGCWWPIHSSGMAENFVGMRALVGYAIRDESLDLEGARAERDELLLGHSKGP